MAEDARKQGHDSSLLTATIAINAILFFMQMLMTIYSIVRICAGGSFFKGFLKLAFDLNYVKFEEDNGRIEGEQDLDDFEKHKQKNSSSRGRLDQIRGSLDSFRRPIKQIIALPIAMLVTFLIIVMPVMLFYEDRPANCKERSSFASCQKCEEGFVMADRTCHSVCPYNSTETNGHCGCGTVGQAIFSSGCYWYGEKSS